jgi:hypothetical protein
MIGGGIYGRGMHDFVLDEMELGFRVASTLDEINAWGTEGATWWAFHPWPTDDEIDATWWPWGTDLVNP